MEAADGGRGAARAQPPRQVEGAGKLVRLHADETGQALARPRLIDCAIFSGRMRALVSS